MFRSDQKPIKFGLRTMFCLVAVGAVISEIGRGLTTRESPFFASLLVFSLGGLAAMLSYLGVGTMIITVTRSAAAQRVGAVVAAVTCVMVWLLCVLQGTFRWPPICFLFATLTLALGVIIIRQSRQCEEIASPAPTLRRLLQTKAELSPRTRTPQHPNDT